MINITPENSVVPIYKEILNKDYVSKLKAESEALTQALEEKNAQKQALKDSAIAKLGLTIEEAQALFN